MSKNNKSLLVFGLGAVVGYFANEFVSNGGYDKLCCKIDDFFEGFKKRPKNEASVENVEDIHEGMPDQFTSILSRAEFLTEEGAKNVLKDMQNLTNGNEFGFITEEAVWNIIQVHEPLTWEDWMMTPIFTHQWESEYGFQNGDVWKMGVVRTGDKYRITNAYMVTRVDILKKKDEEYRKASECEPELDFDFDKMPIIKFDSKKSAELAIEAINCRMDMVGYVRYADLKFYKRALDGVYDDRSKDLDIWNKYGWFGNDSFALLQDLQEPDKWIVTDVAPIRIDIRVDNIKGSNK